MKVAIIVGHTDGATDQAYSVDGTSEWKYNTDIAERLYCNIRELGLTPIRLYRTEKSYTKAVNAYAKAINPDPEFRAVLDLHFNGGPPEAHGYEYIQDGTMGKRLAGHLIEAHEDLFPEMRKRGVKPPWSGRGRPLLTGVRPAATICEPFFGTNRNEWEIYNRESSKQKYAYALAVGTFNYLKTL